MGSLCGYGGGRSPPLRGVSWSSMRHNRSDQLERPFGNQFGSWPDIQRTVKNMFVSFHLRSYSLDTVLGNGPEEKPSQGMLGHMSIHV